MSGTPSLRDETRDIRFCFGDAFKVKQGTHYVGCRCRLCGKIFQVAPRGPANAYGRRRLIDHVKHECIFRMCGKLTP